MDEYAITRKPIRKRAKIGNKCDASSVDSRSAYPNAGIVFLPHEVLSKILSYLSQKDLRAVGRVSKFFQQHAWDPLLWRTYEVTQNEQSTAEVIQELKRMRLLRACRIKRRSDCEAILRQLCSTNTSIEELYISGCTLDGSRPAISPKTQMYLRTGNMIRILKGCRNLHTININWNWFRGQNLYRLLGNMCRQFRHVCVPAIKSQLCTFVKHIPQIDEIDREAILKTVLTQKFVYLTTRIKSSASTEDHVSTTLIKYDERKFILMQRCLGQTPWTIRSALCVRQSRDLYKDREENDA